MWLDELERTVRTLADRIKVYEGTLLSNETATRYALIDPLLVSLGWNLADPSEVQVEHKLGANMRVDYAMLSDGQPYLLIEAKNLGTPLSQAAVQAGQYALTTSARYVVLTNGRQWEGYSLRGEEQEKRVFEFNITSPSSATLDLLWLWNGNFRGRTTRLKLPEWSEVHSPTTITPPRRPRTSGKPLSVVRYKQGMGKPSRLIFPDGTTEDVSKSWASVQVKTAEWLIDNKRVKDLPLRNKRGTHLMHNSPTSKDGLQFKAPRRLRGNYWINTHFNPANHLRRAIELLFECGVEPDTVRLELD